MTDELVVLAGKDAYHLWLIGKGYSKDTVEGRIQVLRPWVRWCAQHQVKPQEATPDHIAAWLLERRQVGRTPSTIRGYLLCLRSYYRFLVETKVRPDDPTALMKTPKVTLKPVRPYSTSDLEALVQAADDPRDRAALLLLLDCGLRASELLGIQHDDIDWTQGTIHIRGKGNRDRVVAPGTTTLQALRDYTGSQPNTIWRGDQGSITTRSGLRSWLVRLATKAGLPRANLHRFRHTFAVSFLENGGSDGDLKELLGHSSLTMTLHYGSHGRQERALRSQRAHSPADRLLRNPTSDTTIV